MRRDYYIPIPDLAGLPADTWDRPSELAGLDLNCTSAIEFVERELAPLIAEMDVPAHSTGVPGKFFLKNTGFETVDA